MLNVQGQVFRYRGQNRGYLRDVIVWAGENLGNAEPLLVEVMRGGQRLRPDPTLPELRQRFRTESACLPERHKALRSPEPFDVQISAELEQLRDRVAQETTWRAFGSHTDAGGAR